MTPQSLRALERDDRELVATCIALAPTLRGLTSAVRAVLVADRADPNSIALALAFDESPAKLGLALLTALQGVPSAVGGLAKGGLPRSITLTRPDLQSGAAGPLARMGVECRLAPEELFFEPHTAPIRGVGDSWKLLRTFAGPLPDGEPMSFAEWKWLERVLCHELFRGFLEDPARFQRAIEAFDIDVEGLSEGGGFAEKLAILAEWEASDYRSRRNARTQIERWLQQPSLPAGIARLLRARRDARLSLYRVQRVEPGVGVAVQCTLSGSEHFVSDVGISESAEVGLCVPMRLLELGTWTFAVLAGAGMGGMLGALLTSRLGAEWGVRSPADLRNSTPAQALLFSGASDVQSWAEAVRNTDGEPLEMSWARLEVLDRPRLLGALAATPSVEFDPTEGDGFWSRPGDPFGDPEGNTILADLEFVDGYFEVRTNSAERMDAALAWLLRLDSVRLIERGAPPLEDTADSDHELDPAQLPPEVLADIQRRIEAQCMRWIDEPVPALGGQTPRDAVRTPDGRREVERLLRTWPAASLPGAQVEPPIERMRRELGLSG